MKSDESSFERVPITPEEALVFARRIIQINNRRVREQAEKEADEYLEHLENGGIKH